ncbi:MAG TPA: hypothetical protein VM366_03535, partial [Anaerolineae bacterium]|nr:hypothetical protein [Anaerolineae bacterium]
CGSHYGKARDECPVCMYILWQQTANDAGSEIESLRADKARLAKALTELCDAAGDQCRKSYCVLDDHDFQQALEAANAAMQEAADGN